MKSLFWMSVNASFCVDLLMLILFGTFVGVGISSSYYYPIFSKCLLAAQTTKNKIENGEWEFYFFYRDAPIFYTAPTLIALLLCFRACSFFVGSFFWFDRDTIFFWGQKSAQKIMDAYRRGMMILSYDFQGAPEMASMTEYSPEHLKIYEGFVLRYHSFFFYLGSAVSSGVWLAVAAFTFVCVSHVTDGAKSECTLTSFKGYRNLKDPLVGLGITIIVLGSIAFAVQPFIHYFWKKRRDANENAEGEESIKISHHQWFVTPASLLIYFAIFCLLVHMEFFEAYKKSNHFLGGTYRCADFKTKRQAMNLGWAALTSFFVFPAIGAVVIRLASSFDSHNNNTSWSSRQRKVNVFNLATGSLVSTIYAGFACSDMVSFKNQLFGNIKNNCLPFLMVTDEEKIHVPVVGTEARVFVAFCVIKIFIFGAEMAMMAWIVYNHGCESIFDPARIRTRNNNIDNSSSSFIYDPTEYRNNNAQEQEQEEEQVSSSFSSSERSNDDSRIDVVECRYCQGGPTRKNLGQLIAPCGCTGSNLYIHEFCLDKWRTTRSVYQTHCEICKEPYQRNQCPVFVISE